MNKLKYACAMAALAGAAFVADAAADTFDRTALEELAGEPITLSATGAPQRVTEAPVNMTIITHEEIARSGAVDLPAVLERLASVDVMRTSRGDADLSIRGYNASLSPRLLVLLNGRQVYLDHYGTTNWSGIPVQLSEIRQIEVVSGPNTALFGFNAVAGVVNIITFDTLQDDVDAASVRLGDPGYAGVSGVWTGRVNERFGVRLSVGGFGAESSAGDDAIIQSTLGRNARDPSSRTVALNAAYDLTNQVRADAEATWSKSDLTGRFLSAPMLNTYETNSLKLGLSAETGLGILNAQIYRNALETANQTIAGLTEQETRTVVASASLVAKPAPAHTVRVGVEYRRNELMQGLGEELGYDLYALSGMWNWQMTGQLALTSAVRIDSLNLERSGPQVSAIYPLTNEDFDRELTEPSVNLGLVYQATAADSLRLSAARGVASPSLNEFGVQRVTTFGPVSIFYTGNPEIEPTIVNNVELGWDHELSSLGGRLRTSVFWQRTNDIKTLGASFSQPSLTTALVLADNIGNSEMFGAEIDVSGRTGRLHWYAQYSWRHIDDSVTMAPTALGIDYEHTSPEHVATAGLNWIGDRWEFGGDARYTSETVQYGYMVSASPDPVPVLPRDAYVQLNLHIAWTPRADTRLELSGRDLLEDETQTIGIAPLERSFYLTLTRQFGAGGHS